MLTGDWSRQVVGESPVRYAAFSIINFQFSFYSNTYANLGGSLIVRRCIDKPKWGNYPLNLRF
jgi:hypothetical protein